MAAPCCQLQDKAQRLPRAAQGCSPQAQSEGLGVAAGQAPRRWVGSSLPPAKAGRRLRLAASITDSSGGISAKPPAGGCLLSPEMFLPGSALRRAPASHTSLQAQHICNANRLGDQGIGCFTRQQESLTRCESCREQQPHGPSGGHAATAPRDPIRAPSAPTAPSAVLSPELSPGTYWGTAGSAQAPGAQQLCVLPSSPPPSGAAGGDGAGAHVQHRAGGSDAWAAQRAQGMVLAPHLHQ